MSKIISERMTAEIEGDFVVFLIGMRVNKPWMVHKWWPAAMAMSKMLKELEAKPELGFLGQISGMKASIQYWRSFDHLESYAKNKDSVHLPAWKSFNQSVGRSRGDVGIWHETYLVKAGEHESVYSGMPPFGLGSASNLVPATGKKESARSRLSAVSQSDL